MSAGLLFPDVESLRLNLAVRSGTDQVTVWMEVRGSPEHVRAIWTVASDARGDVSNDVGPLPGCSNIGFVDVQPWAVAWRCAML